MATPNIVPQSTNDGNLGRHGLRWASVSTYVLSSPIIKLVKDAEALNEEFVQLSVDANGALVLTNDGAQVVTATATDIANLTNILNTLAGVDGNNPTVAGIVASLGDFKSLANKVGSAALPEGYTDLVDAVTKLKVQAGHGGVDFTSVASTILPSQTENFDLGSSDKRWRDLYLSGNTIYLGDVALSLDNNNDLAVTPPGLGAQPVTLGKAISASQIVNGELILTFSDGSQTNLGSVVGPAGAQGPAGDAGAAGADGAAGGRSAPSCW